MADLCLADTVNTAEALFDAIRVPGQVVVHHEMRALKVDTLARCVSGEQNLHIRVVQEASLCLAPLLTTHAAVDEHDRLRATQERTDLTLQIAKGVAVLGEENQLLAWRRGRQGNPAGPIWRCPFPNRDALSRRREDRAKKVCELAPLRVLATAAHFRGESLESSERGYLVPQFRERGGSRCLIEDLFLGFLDFDLRSVLKVFDVVCAERGAGRN